MYFVGYVAYFQLNIDYIVENYCVNKEKPKLQCNGKCHLVETIGTIKVNDDNGDALLNNLAESFFPVFYAECCYNEVLRKLLRKKLKRNLYKEQLYSFPFEYSHFKPPIV